MKNRLKPTGHAQSLDRRVAGPQIRVPINYYIVGGGGGGSRMSDININGEPRTVNIGVSGGWKVGVGEKGWCFLPPPDCARRSAAARARPNHGVPYTIIGDCEPSSIGRGRSLITITAFLFTIHHCRRLPNPFVTTSV